MEEASMCTGLRRLADKKASQIESITTSRQLILASPHKHHCSSHSANALALLHHSQAPLHLFITEPKWPFRGAQVRAF